METQQRSQPRRPDEGPPAVREKDRRNSLAHWLPEIAVTILGAALWVPTLESKSFPEFGPDPFTLVVAATVILSAICFRKAPGVGLTLVWIAFSSPFVLTYLTYSAIGIGIMMHYAFFMAGITAFGTARYGRPLLVRLSGVSIVLMVGFLAVWLGSELISSWNSAHEDRPRDSDAYIVWQYMGSAIVVAVTLGVPWLVGSLLRSQAKTTESEQVAVVARTGEQQAKADRAQAHIEREQAQQIATLRADQARMAREVHDVVGHSLAVVLAQAESSQFLPAESTDEHKRVLADIATTARQSLQDVRAVLGATRDGAPMAPLTTGGMDALIEGVRSAGSDVRSSVVGIPRPLPPERDAVAYRVLQEMLTNALRHGQRDAPITVERHWEGQLRIEVSNFYLPPDEEHTEGTGVDGIRRRLDSIGGHLDVRRRSTSEASDEPGSGRQTYTATAWLPLES